MTSRGHITDHPVRTALLRFGLTTGAALLVGVLPAVLTAVGTRRYIIWSHIVLSAFALIAVDASRRIPTAQEPDVPQASAVR